MNGPPQIKDALMWTERFRDQRSRKVVFLSHCLLNENTRYLGGACRQGCLSEILDVCITKGFGIVQMPCPEQHAWGGVLKRRLLPFLGSEGTLFFRLGGVLLPAMLWYTRYLYHTLARQVANQVRDYVSSGFTVVGIVGVDGSPSCGVRQTLDMRRSLGLVARLSATAGIMDMNAIVQGCLADGRGIFVELLLKEFQRRHLEVPLLAHDLIAEIQGRAISFSL